MAIIGPGQFGMSRFSPGEFRNTEEAMHAVALSEAALALFRLRLKQRRTIDVDVNRETYRELARAGLMVAGHSFAGGDESIYRLTKEGFERKAEILAHARQAG
jgi:hypothetical protein